MEVRVIGMSFTHTNLEVILLLSLLLINLLEGSESMLHCWRFDEPAQFWDFRNSFFWSELILPKVNIVETCCSNFIRFHSGRN
jgi:hypothetical protein